MGDAKLLGFLFHGRAVALSGSVQKPSFFDMGEHAVAEFFAGSGGSASSVVNQFSAGGISYKSARSEVIGHSSGGVYSTIVSTVIEDLRIFDWLTVDRIVSRLESVFLESDYPRRKTPRILPTGSTIVGLRVNGKTMDLDLPEAFDINYNKADEFLYGRSSKLQEPAAIPKSLYIANLGTIHYAEWTWVGTEKKEQRLTMLRLGLGSDDGGNLGVGECQSNGSGIPS